MKTTELRLGNLIEYCGEVLPVKTLFSMNRVSINTSFLKDGIMQNIDKCKPIPLTEDWLIKFGFEMFEEIQTLKHYWIDDTGLMSIRESKYNNRAYDLIVHVRIDETVLIMSFDYVHEIQNYFALTGKELAII